MSTYSGNFSNQESFADFPFAFSNHLQAVFIFKLQFEDRATLLQLLNPTDKHIGVDDKCPQFTDIDLYYFCSNQIQGTMLRSFNKCACVSYGEAHQIPIVHMKLILSGNGTQAYAIIEGSTSSLSIIYQTFMLAIADTNAVHNLITGVYTAFFLSTRYWEV